MVPEELQLLEFDRRSRKLKIDDSFRALRRNQTAPLPSHDDEHDYKKQKRNLEISFHTMKIKKPLLVQRLFK